MTQSSGFLFVYGTLMKQIDTPMSRLLSANSTYIGPGTTQGKLYRISWFPGLVRSDDPDDVVHGELYKLQRVSDALLVKMDEYEDIGPQFPEPHEYKREVCDVLHGGTVFRAMSYIYQWSVADAQHLPSGVFSNS